MESSGILIIPKLIVCRFHSKENHPRRKWGEANRAYSSTANEKRRGRRRSVAAMTDEVEITAIRPLLTVKCLTQVTRCNHPPRAICISVQINLNEFPPAALPRPRRRPQLTSSASTPSRDNEKVYDAHGAPEIRFMGSTLRI